MAKGLRSATLVFVRHSEKLGGDDPELSPDGQLRAKKLAKLLAAVPVTRVFSTGYRRTRQTARFVCDAKAVELESYEARGSAAFCKELLAPGALEAGAAALVVGHSNTLPMMVKAAGGAMTGLVRGGVLDESEYDRVVIVALAAVDDAPLVATSVVDLRIEMD